MRAAETVRQRRSRRWAALLVLAVVLVTVGVVLAVVLPVGKEGTCERTPAAGRSTGKQRTGVKYYRPGTYAACTI